MKVLKDDYFKNIRSCLLKKFICSRREMCKAKLKME